MKKKNKWVFPVVALLVIAGIVLLPKLIEDKKEAVEESASVLSARAEIKTIDKTLSGTGTLTSEESLDVELPSGVEITRYIVKNGDTVVKGQALAYVDRVSVMQAVSDCQATLDYIEEEMFAEEYKNARRYLSVPAKGTITAIYAEAGDKVQDVMLEHGCLAIADINGEEWKFEAYTGTVSNVICSVGDTVYPGTNYIFLDDVEETSAYDVLQTQRAEYEDIMAQLQKINMDGVLSAPCDGMVDGIDEDEADRLDREAGIEKEEIIIPEEERPERPEGFPEGMPSFGSGEMPEGMPSFGSGEMPEGMPPFGNGDAEGKAAVKADAASSEVENRRVLVLHAISPVYEGEVVDVIKAETIAYSDGTITFIEGDVFSVSINGESYRDGDKGAVIKWDSFDGDKNALRVNDQIRCDITDDGTNITIVPVYKSSQQPQQQPQFDPSMSGMMGMMSGGFGGFGGVGGMGYSSSSEEEEEFEMYSSDSEVVMTVTPQETLSISITVDELDILSVSVGQEAIITIDAVPGKSYRGMVTEINSTGTSNTGGNSKYTATVTMNNEEGLLAGMNASTLITIGSTENVLTVPVKALSEENGKTYVYTGYDDKAEKLINPVEVTTGASDGERVEILTGLKEGDTVRYEYYDKIELDTMSSGGTIGLGSLFGGGNSGPGGFGSRR